MDSSEKPLAVLSWPVLPLGFGQSNATFAAFWQAQVDWTTKVILVDPFPLRPVKPEPSPQDE